MEQKNVCPLAKRCGGCDYQGISYKEQLAKKQRAVTALLKEFCPVHEITGMENPYHYRNNP